ncbi:hypothetical protein CFC21_038575 [Triticum aestivum]|uniref:Pathogenesis-related protein 1 n=3 Tax=Triticum TaxID=4564 RepID=A0A9R1FCR1_WHEAT|nr:pathogenesis-related protein 1-like [Triticum dicoccoides]XP_037410661.1 pathogenesis-related protein 1-like [Triticum dicoccoides]XP_037470146.1 pathogenesis-related protein 1-like [Triticum dicoccoides]XP_037470717.1 pathogenesis-related protein 1-like [Triticum dicoccoides]XP_044338094.1 pathogenesis-related protein 1-like [Triticum aestivum]VAH70166.1 unnamed protein product [Triticum turgidum subsp. durum]AEI28607.1 pathogenesis-related protein 1 [Triticum aestivum]KAF7026466.1 hypot
MEYSPKLAAALLLALASAMIVTAQNGADDMLNAHNEVRAAVGVGPVTWDPIVAAYAQSYAEKRRADCQLLLSPEVRPYGENLFRAAGAEWNAVDAVIYWASGKQYYDHATNTCSAPTGESCMGYLQLVWRDTKTIGCGAVLCDGNAGVFVICSYSPPPVLGQIPY